MNKTFFFSQLFCREIHNSDKDYKIYIKAELLYRIQDMKEKDCSCSYCKNKLKEYVDYYEKEFGKKKVEDKL